MLLNNYALGKLLLPISKKKRCLEREDSGLKK
jgi:hypothetical protein